MTSLQNTSLVRSMLHMLSLVSILMLFGCSTIRNGGAPEPSFSYEKDLQDLEKLFSPAATIASMGTSPTQESRNAFIDGRLALYNIRYVRFVRDLGVDKQHLDAATDIMLLALNLSSAATSAIRTKTNLALAAAGVTGGKVTIDKHFYFEKSIPALVSTMNAQRKLVLINIIQNRAKGIDEYPLTAALDDLSNYEMAGTLIGAITNLQADAAVKEKVAEEKLKNLELPTSEQIAEKRRLATALASLSRNSSENLKMINSLLTSRREMAVDIKDFNEAKSTLSTEFREDSLLNLPKWRKAITDAGITIGQ